MNTKMFEITKTVKDEDVPAAKESIKAMLEEIGERIPGAVVGEITVEPSIEERSRPLRMAEVRIN